MLKFLFCILFSVLTLAPAWGDHNSASCKTCSSNTKPVAVLLYDPDMFSVLNEYIATDWFQPPPNLEIIRKAIHSVHEIPDILKQISKDCPRIAYLGIHSHGSIGSFSVNDSSANLYTLMNGFSGLVDCVMADNARIEFSGCNIGRGCRGENFLISVAHAFLKRGGGSVKAATNYTAFVPFALGSINGDNQIIYAKPGLSEWSWDNKPQSINQCRSRALSALETLKDIRLANEICGSRENRETIKLAAHQLKTSVSYSNYERTWTGIDQSHFEMGEAFHSGFYYYEHALENVSLCFGTTIAAKALAEGFEKVLGPKKWE